MAALPLLLLTLWISPVRAESPPSPMGDMGYLVRDIGAVLDLQVGTGEARASYERLRQLLLSRSDGVSEADLLLGAMHGMLEAANHRARESCSASAKALPPTAMLLGPSQAEELQRGLLGEMTGIGIEFQRDEGRGGWAVTRVLVGSPGDRAGLRPGDLLVSVDGRALAGRTLDEVLAALQGAEGSGVKLGVVRQFGPGAGRLSLALRRGRFVVPTVSAHLDDEGSGLLRIHRFTGRTPVEARTAIKELRTQGMERLVVDLRANPGGDLASVPQIAGLLLPTREILLRTHEPGKTPADLWAGGDNQWDGPVAVLVDRWTRGVAEAMAVSLQEMGRAVVIGEPTMGVARTEALVPLGTHLIVRLDSVQLETGRGLAWDGQGVIPDVPVTLDVSVVLRGPGEGVPMDAQVQAAVHTLKVQTPLP